MTPDPLCEFCLHVVHREGAICASCRDRLNQETER